jgi:hypothetical protein
MTPTIIAIILGVIVRKRQTAAAIVIVIITIVIAIITIVTAPINFKVTAFKRNLTSSFEANFSPQILRQLQQLLQFSTVFAITLAHRTDATHQIQPQKAQLVVDYRVHTIRSPFQRTKQTIQFS